MTAASTAIEICSRASILIGGNPITSFSDGTVEADVANSMYEDVARTALTNSRWRFATKQDILTLLVGQTPLSKFSYAYEVPTDCLMLSAVSVGGANIEYRMYSGTSGYEIVCDASDNEEVVADYIYRASETDWPPYFITAVEYEMAALMAISVARDSALASMLQQKAMSEMIKARRLESQQQTTNKLHTTRFIQQRRS